MIFLGFHKFRINMRWGLGNQGLFFPEKCHSTPAHFFVGNAMKALDLIEQRFGRLTVVKPTKRRDGSNIIWLCLCDCGNECFVSTGNLGRSVNSCGCLFRESHTIHGMSNTSIYKLWQQMIQRCENPNYLGYKNYGGRGIKVCERWHSFENFYADVGDRPEDKTLDRWPDNDGDYEPTNWRWATRHEQNLNSRPLSYGPNKQRWFLAFELSTGNWFEDNSQNKFAKEHGLSRSRIGECLSKKYKQTKGWTFEFLTEK